MSDIDTKVAQCARDGCTNPVRAKRRYGGHPAKFCSVKCRQKYWRVHSSGKLAAVRLEDRLAITRELCARPGCTNQIPFSTHGPLRRYCSLKCGKASYYHRHKGTPGYVERIREHGRKSDAKPARQLRKAATFKMRLKNDPSLRAHYRVRSKLSRYKISREQYDDMLRRCGGLCEVCGDTNGNMDLAIDHRHDPFLVRGLLCMRCNALIGMAKDSIERLLAAAAYLKKYS